MKIEPGITVFDMAKDLGLAIEYSHDLPLNVRGLLDQRQEPLFILVNANDPEFEQRFTIAHELGHYFIHHNRPRRKHLSFLLDREWESHHMREICRYTRAQLAEIFSVEWEADLWGLGLLIQIGDVRTLKQYLNEHRAKIGPFILVLLSTLQRPPPWLFQMWFHNVFAWPSKAKS